MNSKRNHAYIPMSTRSPQCTPDLSIGPGNIQKGQPLFSPISNSGSKMVEITSFINNSSYVHQSKLPSHKSSTNSPRLIAEQVEVKKGITPTHRKYLTSNMISKSPSSPVVNSFPIHSLKPTPKSGRSPNHQLELKNRMTEQPHESEIAKECKLLKQKLKEKVRQCELHQSQVRQKNARIQELQLDLKSQQLSEIKSSVKKEKDESLKFKEEVSDLTKWVVNLNKMLKDEREKNEDLSGWIRNLNGQVKKERGENEDLTKWVRKLNENSGQLEKENRSLKEEVKEKEKDLEIRCLIASETAKVIKEANEVAEKQKLWGIHKILGKVLEEGPENQ